MGGLSQSLITLAARRGLPAVAVLGDEWPYYGAIRDRWWRLRRRLPGAGRIEDSARWIFVSERLQEVLVGRGFDPPCGRVVHNGIDLERFGPAREHPWEWNLLYVGRLDPRKGVHTAVEALAHLPGEATLTVLGGGDDAYRRELEELAGPNGRVRFDVREHADLPNAYRSADALLFPTEWEEPFGLVPLEAMACGCPVVTTALGGSAEYFRHEENALVFARAEGATALAAALIRLAGDTDLRARIRENGYTTAARSPNRRSPRESAMSSTGR